MKGIITDKSVFGNYGFNIDISDYTGIIKVQFYKDMLQAKFDSKLYDGFRKSFFFYCNALFVVNFSKGFHVFFVLYLHMYDRSMMLFAFKNRISF